MILTWLSTNTIKQDKCFHRFNVILVDVRENVLNVKVKVRFGLIALDVMELEKLVSHVHSVMEEGCMLRHLRNMVQCLTTRYINGEIGITITKIFIVENAEVIQVLMGNDTRKIEQLQITLINNVINAMAKKKLNVINA